MLKLAWWFRSRVNLFRFRNKPVRQLEIGPGDYPLPGFETLNIVGGRWVDYVFDAAKPMPFDTGSFDLIYASHVLEHVPWYQTVDALTEWVRILKPGGVLEVWVPNALKICRSLVEFEDGGSDQSRNDGWYRYNDDRDPCKWAAGRIYTYGDGRGTLDHPNWHRALFTPRYLQKVLQQAGLSDVRFLTSSDVRGYDHGWINLGAKGVKVSSTELHLGSTLGVSLTELVS